MRALVLEHRDARSALAAARALAAVGWTVGIGSAVRRSVATASRATSAWHDVPAAADSRERFVDGVDAAVRDGRYEVVFPCGDADLLALSAHRDAISAVVPYAPHGNVLSAIDKLELAAVAERVGMAAPQTYAGEEPPDWSPVMVKARLRAPEKQLSAWHDTQRVAGPAEAARRAREIRASGGRPFFQEVIDGCVTAYVMVTDRDGVVRAQAAQESERVWPAQAGVSVRARSIRPDPRVTSRVAALLGELGWFGLAQLQFVTPPGGEPLLIDFNGRFFGSLQLTISSGLNAPSIWASLATGRPASIQMPRPGVRYHWLEGDLRWVMDRGSRRLSGTVESLRYACRANHSVWSARDPMPTLQHGAQLAARAVRRVTPWTSRGSSTT